MAIVAAHFGTGGAVGGLTYVMLLLGVYQANDSAAGK